MRGLPIGDSIDVSERKTAMKTETVNLSASPKDGEQVPTVSAKKFVAGEPAAGSQPPSQEEQNAVEIARLAAWATAECGRPILAD